MKTIWRSIPLLALFGFLSIAHAQQIIAPSQAANFIGQEATVCGPVVKAYYGPASGGKLTTLGLGGSFWGQNLAVLIPDKDRNKFEKPPETLYAGKQICVTGMLKTYQGGPVIVVKNPDQIEVK